MRCIICNYIYLIGLIVEISKIIKRQIKREKLLEFVGDVEEDEWTCSGVCFSVFYYQFYFIEV
mgnify:FL=1